MSDHGAAEFDREGAEDLITALTEAELIERLEGLVEEERVVSYKREILRGRIDLIWGELAGRGTVALSPEELVRVLMGEPHEGGSP
jgi:hypothetical protein